jgi:hypothetical protein
LARVLVIFALCGWIAGALVLGTNKDATFLGSLWTAWPLRSAIAAALGALVWGPLLAWARLRWYLGALVGLVAGLTALYLFFFIWPPEMQAGRLAAWKTAGLFITVYWRFLIPSSVVAGALGAEWTRWPVRTPRWQQIADGEDLPEIPVPAPPRPAPAAHADEADTEAIAPPAPTEPSS